MFAPEKFFSNIFAHRLITSFRLLNFADDLLNRLIATNADGGNTILINKLTPALARLKEGLGETDTARLIRRGTTLTVDAFLENFRQFIRFYEGAIRVALGGTKTQAYVEFFPGGAVEYTKATKTRMPVLLNRLKTVATKYSGKLDAAIAAKLVEFEDTWQAIRDEQAQQTASLDDNRNNRQGARKEMEIVLMKIVYAIGDRYTGDEGQCGKHFDFSLLHGHSRKKKKEVNMDKA